MKITNVFSNDNYCFHNYHADKLYIYYNLVHIKLQFIIMTVRDIRIEIISHFIQINSMNVSLSGGAFLE